jgi:hypothetical protein
MEGRSPLHAPPRSQRCNEAAAAASKSHSRGAVAPPPVPRLQDRHGSPRSLQVPCRFEARHAAANDDHLQAWC